ncbi:MAG TPA: ELWxxDGT repeat protein, partial [Parafilimonas sp.]|nr:ELWxxDGT repeat protein [Parafilimonas sp.]
MKPKNLLLLAVMIMYTALAGLAQNGAYKEPPAKDIFQFGQRRSLPDLSKYPGISLQGTNTAFMKGINSFNANEIKKHPEEFKQQLQKGRAIGSQSFQRNHMHAANGPEGNNSHSDFHLTKDLNALAESNPGNAADFYVNTSYATLHQVAYFAADDGVHGNELWRSDGTAAGTFMVKDIEPGAASTYLYNITAVNGKIYFSAATAAYGLEPWVSDGTENGTQLLMDIKPGPLWSYPTEFAGADNQVYFVSDGDFSSWGALWKTDGTTAGTKLVKSIGDEGGGGTLITQPTEANGQLFFTFLNFSTFSWELWRSDGTNAGTYAVSSNTYFPSVPAQLTHYNNKLYFSADDGTGRKLWVSDGTDAGTTPAPNNNDIVIDADYLGTTFPVLNSVLYIPGS